MQTRPTSPGQVPPAEAWSGIEMTPGVCGGSARVAGTRIPVWSLEQSRRLGATPHDLAREYPSLRPVDIVAAWDYADSHPDEMARDLRENEDA